jgi:hypothetical protein
VIVVTTKLALSVQKEVTIPDDHKTLVIFRTHAGDS